MVPFESMKNSFNQPLIPVVLGALVEGHPAFGNVACKNSPAASRRNGLIASRQWKKGVSFAMGNGGAGFMGVRFAIRNEQKIGERQGIKMMNPKKITFGIVGGIGPLAGADLFFKFVKSTPAYDDSQHFNVVLEQQPLREKTAYADEDYDPTTRKLHIFNLMQKLIDRQASCIILSCFIGHTFLHELEKSIDVPIINMMEGLREYVQTRHQNVKTIGILTSDYVRKKQLFEQYFPSPGYDIIYPERNIQQNFLMEAIYGPHGIKAGHLTGKVIEYLEKSCENLFEKGAELIIPGFTEIPVVYDALKKKKRFHIIDSNQVYADWAIRSYNKAPVGKQLIIGIIGGLGPSATVDLMDKIIKNTPAQKDQDHFQMIVEHDPHIPDRTAHLLKEEEDPTISLYNCAKKLEEREADFIAIPCNTAHAFIDRIQKHLSIPIINMIEEAIHYIHKNFPDARTVGLLATSGTVKTGIYHKAFEKTGIHLISPNDEYQQLVMESIYGRKGIKAGYTEGEPRKNLFEAAKHLVEQGAEVIILGCTELPLVVEQTNRCLLAGRSVAILDPTNILAKKCVALVLRKN
jgi:aspartate racemase